MHPEGLSPPFTFIAPAGLAPRDSRDWSTPWSVFQDGSLAAITPASVRTRSSVRAGRMAPGAITPPWGPRSPSLCPAARTDAGPAARACPAPQDGWSRAAESGRKRFPFHNFTCCLTLFPKCFSSFAHATCALSVSGGYLALDGIYHPLGAAFPNNSTRRKGPAWGRAARPRTGFSPSVTPCSKGPGPAHAPGAPSANYNSGRAAAGFQI